MSNPFHMASALVRAQGAGVPNSATMPPSGSSQSSTNREQLPTPESEHSRENVAAVEKEEQKVTIVSSSTLLGPLTVHFSDQSARLRAAAKKNPQTVYRTHSEHSAALSSFVVPERHVRHPENPRLKLQAGNAFQSVGELNPARDFTRERVERHMVTPMIQDPTAYISVQTSIDAALAMAMHRYTTSKKCPRLFFIAEMDVSGLVPAVLKGPLKTIKKWYTALNPLVPIKYSDKTRDVTIPIWVMDKEPYNGEAHTRTDTTIKDIYAEEGVVWLRMNELTQSDLKVKAARTHGREWLAVGRIPSECIRNVWPFDGETLHKEKSSEFVRSIGSVEVYFWNFDRRMWLHKPDVTDFRPYREKCVGDKRKEDDAQIQDILTVIGTELKRIRRRSG